MSPRFTAMAEIREVYIYPTVDNGTWVVEACIPAAPRGAEMAVFSSGRSEERARRYCQQEYGIGCTELIERRPTPRPG